MIREEIKKAIIDYYKKFGYDWMIDACGALKKDFSDIVRVINRAELAASEKMDLIIRAVNKSNSFYELFNIVPDTQRLFDDEGNFNPTAYEGNDEFDITGIYIDEDGI